MPVPCRSVVLPGVVVESSTVLGVVVILSAEVVEIFSSGVVGASVEDVLVRVIEVVDSGSVVAVVVSEMHVVCVNLQCE